jgi:uncharacterized tellurite resistance protein B-like protein
MRNRSFATSLNNIFCLNMFETIKTAIANFGLPGSPASRSNHLLEVETTALLIRVATVDAELSETRYRKLHSVVASTFDLSDENTSQLILHGMKLAREAVDLYRFTRQLNQLLDYRDRCHVVQMMWDVVCSDGAANDIEDNFIWRASDLLGVSTRARVHMRQQFSRQRAALAV